MGDIYLDYAATTPLDSRVKEAMEPYWTEEYGNPSSLHRFGERAKRAMRDARLAVARVLGAKPGEVAFTAGGTESINLAILGAAKSFARQGHLVTTKIEHHAVLRAVEALEKEGFAVTYLDVDEQGLVGPEVVRAAIRPDTILVSVMYANNEIGTVEPIAEIGKVIREVRAERERKGVTAPIFFHTDACQAPRALDLNVEKLGVDLMSLDGSKIYGPKGVGCLFVRRGVVLAPLIRGGGQERGLRSGTENVPGIVGFAKALEIAASERERENARLAPLRDHFVREVFQRIPDAVLNGHPSSRLPSHINISIPGVDGEAAVIYLDAKGIAASTGSACSSVSFEPSHVVRALGRTPELARGSLRFTLGRRTSEEELNYVLEVLPEVVAKLREREIHPHLAEEKLLTPLP